MARGKHTHAAAVRREAAEQEAEIEVYQRKIREMVADHRREKERDSDKIAALQRQVDILRAQVREGTSPELAVAERENRKLREERDHLAGRVKSTQRKWERALGRMRDHFKAVHHMTNLEATEELIRIAGDNLVEGLPPLPEGKDLRDIVITDEGPPGKMTADQVKVLQQVRGRRRREPVDTAEYLD